MNDVTARTPLRVIVNVDDLGMHPAVRRAVEECAALGTVTSASVMANGPDLAAVRPVRGVSMGAHLNVLRGRPLSPAREVRSLVGDDGLFLGSFARFATRALRGTIRHDELRLEWSRQIARLREHGLELSHVDGEKHTHCLPGLFAIACEVAREAGIAWVRRSVEARGNPAFGAAWLRRALLRAWCERAHPPAGIRCADRVWGIAEQGARFTSEAFVRATIDRLDAGEREVATSEVVEIVCHPGRPHRGDPALPEGFGRMRVAALWEPELRSLLEDPWRALAIEHGWTLTGFDTLD
ncbi:MAG: ChbG/HpnK family deacetylase [Planctomycetaceae bacterium]|nr:ChbG/HpnK family deacetylase [Planctomycetaceae bacterium]